MEKYQFTGKTKEFLEKVGETHGNSRHAQVYRGAAELAKLQINLTEEGNEKE